MFDVPSAGKREMARRMRGILCLAVMVIVTAGCTKVVFMGNKGELSQKMKITSDPPGAQVFLMGSIPLGETPLLDVKIEQTYDTFLTLKKEGYEDKNLLLRHHFHVVLIPKKASREQRAHVARTKTARDLTLIGYSEVQHNLAVGRGEYLASLLVTLRVPESEQGNAIRQLQELMAAAADPLDFSDRVLDRFHVSRF
ncbi:MAG TPA: PEGA domain-containing protein [Terriglobales bacterium]|nr:PEGA domain-containing protein [Terriglobales bacterium]